mmetsp:Transcript_21724/g.45265  ORF Transcript_21724/g.45265 Transcript_21724/m.45265 type:complete len:138 (+) Transcript_21724:32-445(+)
MRGGIYGLLPLGVKEVKRGVVVRFEEIGMEGLKGGVWKGLEVDEDVTEDVVGRMKGFKVVGNGKMVVSKYGGIEIGNDEVVRGLEGFVRKKSRKRWGGGKKKEDGFGRVKKVGDGVTLEMCKGGILSCEVVWKWNND